MPCVSGPVPEPAPPVIVPLAAPMAPTLAAAIRAARLRGGWSQRQLAARFEPAVPRTYVSKLENDKASPTMWSLSRLARALEVTVPYLLSGGERNRQDEVADLVKDHFIAELLPFVSRLSATQMSSVLAQAHDLALRHPSRAAAA